MDELLRRIRGILGVSAMWGGLWAVLFAVLFFIIGVFDPDTIDPGETLGLLVTIGATFGLVSGVSFAVLLAAAEGRKTLAELSPLRVALWGALATSVLPLLSPADDRMLVFLCPIGAALTAASVALAKRAELAAPAEAPRLTE